MSDLFPGKKRPELDYGALFAVMKLVIQRKGLQPHPFFITKVRTSTEPFLCLRACSHQEESMRLTTAWTYLCPCTDAHR